MPQWISRREFLFESMKGTAILYWGHLGDLISPFVSACGKKSKGGNEMIYVETAGTPYEIGRQYGEKLANQVRRFIKDVVKNLDRRFEHEPMQKALQTMLNVLEHDFPYLIDEMRGMADGAKLNFKDVTLGNLSSGLGAYIGEKEGCSNIIFTESNHGPILGKTLDGSKPESDTGVVRIIRPTEGRTVLCETRIGGISTETGINDEGLAVGESSIHFYTVNPRGIIRNILPRLILQECANVEEGIQFLSRYPVLRFGFHFALVDKAGNAAVVDEGKLLVADGPPCQHEFKEFSLEIE